MSEREPIFDDLRRMFEALDPPPEHLEEAMIAAVAAEDLDSEYALLSLLSRNNELVGTRGAGPLTVEFAYNDVTVLLRVTDGPKANTRRIDGWITPSADGNVRLVAGENEVRATLRSGRFEIESIPCGLIRVWFEVTGRDDLATPTFEV
ncbi:MAG TPA: hypothetical protein PLQ19_04055 [Aeromicrobium sp.]|nr:hypothetical protein [Aeromicrobium sp.]